MNHEVTALFHNDRGFIDASGNQNIIRGRLLAIRAIANSDSIGNRDRLHDYIVVSTPKHPCQIEQSKVKNAADWILTFD